MEDVVTYLVKSIDVKETEGREFEVGGSDVLTYVDMMKRYAKMINKSVRILIIPFLTPRLSSYWVDSRYSCQSIISKTFDRQPQT